MFRFRLSTLMLFVVIAALATPPIYRHFKEKPIELAPYSHVALKDQLSSNRPAIVLFLARWELQSQHQITNSTSMWALMRDKSVLAMSADCTSIGAPGEKLMRQIGISTLPAFAVYMPNDPTNPVVVSELATESTIRAALAQSSSSTKDRTKR